MKCACGFSTEIESVVMSRLVDFMDNCPDPFLPRSDAFAIVIVAQ